MNDNKKFFLTTSLKNLYLISALTSKKYLEKKNKQSYRFKKVEYEKFYLKFINFFFKEFTRGNLFNRKKFVKLKYNNFSLGRYVLSTFIRKSFDHNYQKLIVILSIVILSFSNFHAITWIDYDWRYRVVILIPLLFLSVLGAINLKTTLIKNKKF